MVLSPVLRQAVFSRKLSPIDLRVLLATAEVLDYCEYRPLKSGWIAQQLRLTTAGTAESLRRLTEAGFLNACVPDRYRLPFSQRRSQDEVEDEIMAEIHSSYD